jgi:hypothetical protein
MMQIDVGGVVNYGDGSHPHQVHLMMTRIQCYQTPLQRKFYPKKPYKPTMANIQY